MGRKDLTAGTWGSFAERAARSLAAPAATAETAADSPAQPQQPGPPAPSEAGPPPPPDGGPWAWMDLPDGAGTVLVRAVRWVRSGSGGWALQVTAPGWKAITDWVDGGWEPGPVDEYHVVPGTRVRPIPGQDYTGLRRDDDGRLVP